MPLDHIDLLETYYLLIDNHAVGKGKIIKSHYSMGVRFCVSEWNQNSDKIMIGVGSFSISYMHNNAINDIIKINTAVYYTSKIILHFNVLHLHGCKVDGKGR